jgi:hypothetical protein
VLRFNRYEYFAATEPVAGAAVSAVSSAVAVSIASQRWLFLRWHCVWFLTI